METLFWKIQLRKELGNYKAYNQGIVSLHQDENFSFNLLNRTDFPDLTQSGVATAYFEERVGTPERLIACVTRGELEVRYASRLLNNSALAEWNNAQKIASDQYDKKTDAYADEFKTAYATLIAEYKTAVTGTFWIRLWHAVWPPAKNRMDSYFAGKLLDAGFGNLTAQHETVFAGTFWIRWLRAVWPPAKTRYEIAREAERKYIKSMRPMYQRLNNENEAAYNEYQEALIADWVAIFTKPENRIESWR